MNTSPVCHRRSVGVKVFFLLACVLVVVVCEVTVAAAFAPNPLHDDAPAVLVAETVEGIQARRQHASAAHTQPLRRPAAPSRKHLVREMDHEDWHLLDGDQLLPNDYGNDALEVLQKRREQHEAAEKADAPPSILMESREAAPAPRRLNCREPDFRSFPDAARAEVVAAAEAQKPAHNLRMTAPPPTMPAPHGILAGPKVPAPPLEPLPAGEDAEADKIALASLRLVVHVKNEGEEEEGAEEAKEAAALPRGRAARPLRFGGPSILLKQPQQELNVRAVQPVRFVDRGNDAAARTAHLVLQDAGDQNSVPKRTYSDEELRRRCVLANGRAAQTSTLRAMMEGRLGKDCLVVAADVGNDIPGEKNNAKGAVTIVTVFVSTLFVVFAFCF